MFKTKFFEMLLIEKKALNNLKYSGFFFFISAVIIMLLGLSTYLWKPVNVHVSYYNEKNICISGYSNVARPGVRQIKSGVCNYVSVDYHYTLDQKLYSKSFIGFYMPINIHLESFGSYKTTTAYYLPFFPGISVIKRGFGFGLVFVLSFIGYFCLLARKTILNYLSKFDDQF
jgi:hypothetical protein